MQTDIPPSANELIENCVPSLPEVFFKLREALEDPDCSFDVYSSIISSDPGLVARLLKIVNSSFYGFSSRVETITHALSIVGISQLSDLVLATAILNEFKGIPKSLFDMKKFWSHNLACGIGAQTLAVLRGEDNSERFFLYGLLHDLGKLVMLKKIPDVYIRVLEVDQSTDTPTHKIESDIIGYGHGEVGGELLKAWNLPPSIVEAVTFHHEPFAAEDYFFETATVYLANSIVNQMEKENWEESLFQNLESDILDMVNLSENQLEAIPREIEAKLEEYLRVFF